MTLSTKDCILPAQFPPGSIVYLKYTRLAIPSGHCLHSSVQTSTGPPAHPKDLHVHPSNTLSSRVIILNRSIVQQWVLSLASYFQPVHGRVQS